MFRASWIHDRVDGPAFVLVVPQTDEEVSSPGVAAGLVQSKISSYKLVYVLHSTVVDASLPRRCFHL